MEKKKVYTFKMEIEFVQDMSVDFEDSDLEPSESVDSFLEGLEEYGLKTDEYCSFKIKSSEYVEGSGEFGDDGEYNFQMKYTAEHLLKVIELEKNESRERLWTLVFDPENIWNNTRFNNDNMCYSDFWLTKRLIGITGKSKEKYFDKVFGVKTKDIDEMILARAVDLLSNDESFESEDDDYRKYYISAYNKRVESVKAELIEEKEYDKI